VKLKLKWNDFYFVFDNKPQLTELFSVELCKEYNYWYTKIRNNMCITITNKNYGYITPKRFVDED